MRLLQCRVRRQLTVVPSSEWNQAFVVETHPYPKSQNSSLAFEIAVSDMFVWRGLAFALGGGWRLCYHQMRIRSPPKLGQDE